MYGLGIEGLTSCDVLSYSVLLLRKLREMFPDHHIQLMYDVACIHLMISFYITVCIFNYMYILYLGHWFDQFTKEN